VVTNILKESFASIFRVAANSFGGLIRKMEGSGKGNKMAKQSPR
jgi:hypothetical protein